MKTLRLILPLLLLILMNAPAGAASASWTSVNQGLDPWTDVNNWTPATVPNGPNDIATFPSTTNGLTIPEVTSPIELDSLIFDLGCPLSYQIDIFSTLTISGGGIVNNSGNLKSILVDGELDFTGSAVAGDRFCSFQTISGTAAIRFFDTASPGRAFLVANAVQNVGEGGLIEFNDNSTGGSATIRLLVYRGYNGSGTLAIYNHEPPGVSIGTLFGNGNVLLGAVGGPPTGRNLTVGGNNNPNNTLSGVIEDAGKGGSLTKIGTGQLVLKSANHYTGGTLVFAGQLIIANTTGSATGTGAVSVVRSGALGGFGTIAGTVTVGTGVGTGGQLAPSIASNQPSNLIIRSSLTFKRGGAYSPQLYTSVVATDQVRANGVTIESGALFLAGADEGSVALGTVFTVISNDGATPISGSFSNLADGSTLTIGSNNFQASYEGGDGNDLTLTVVP